MVVMWLFLQKLEENGSKCSTGWPKTTSYRLMLLMMLQSGNPPWGRRVLVVCCLVEINLPPNPGSMHIIYNK